MISRLSPFCFWDQSLSTAGGGEGGREGGAGGREGGGRRGGREEGRGEGGGEGWRDLIVNGITYFQGEKKGG